MTLNPERFSDIIKAAGVVISSSPVILSNGQPGIAKVHNFYHSKEYALAFGRATIYYNQTGTVVGFYDYYNFDPKPWGVRSTENEMKTRSVNAVGTLYGATPFSVTYGIIGIRP